MWPPTTPHCAIIVSRQRCKSTLIVLCWGWGVCIPRSISSYNCLTLLWPQWNRSLFLHRVPCVETGLPWCTQNGFLGQCWLQPHGSGDLCGFGGLFCRMPPQSTLHRQFPRHNCDSVLRTRHLCLHETSHNFSKVFTLLCTIIVPMPDPLIYTLTNMQMRNTIRKVWCPERFGEGKTMIWG